MSHLNRFYICTLIACVAFFANFSSALAIPALPSSFYGMAKINNANVPDGTVIQAFNGNQMIAQGYSQTYQGDSVYSLDIPGDNTDTTVIDGGREGDTITFKAGGLLASQTGIWHSATNVQLNLNAASTSTPMAPLATPTAIPTQTPITVIPQASKIPAPVGQAPPTAIIPFPTQTMIAGIQPASKIPEPVIQASPTVIISFPPQTMIAGIQPASKTPGSAAWNLPTAIISPLDTKGSDSSTAISEIPTQSLPASNGQAAGSPRNTILTIVLSVIVILGAGFTVWIRIRK